MSRFRKGIEFSGLQYIVTSLEFELDSIRAFIEESTIMIEDKENRLYKDYKELEEDMKNNLQKYWDTESGIETAYDYFEYDFMNLSGFSTILFNSIFVSLYSELEVVVFKICTYCQSHQNLQIGAKDINGKNDIMRGKKYLEKVIGVNFDSIKDVWLNFTFYQKIRNLIVHSKGNRKIEEKNLLLFISNTRGIDYDESQESLKIEDKTFLLDFCLYFENLVNNITQQVIQQKNIST